MESTDKSPFLTPTYQTVLINALNTAVTSMLEGNPDYTLKAFNTLFSILKPPQREDLKESWNSYLNGLAKIEGEGTYGARHNRLKEKVKDYLIQSNPTMMQCFIDVLDKYKMLEMDVTAKPKYRKKGHLKI